MTLSRPESRSRSHDHIGVALGLLVRSCLHFAPFLPSTIMRLSASFATAALCLAPGAYAWGAVGQC